MKKSSIILTTLLSIGMVSGALTAFRMTHVKEEQGIIQAKAEGEVNDVFSKVYSDDWNNTGSTTLSTLFSFTGTAHGLGDATITDADILANFKINDVPLSQLGESVKIAAWNGNNFLQVFYPATALSGAGTTFEVETGATIGASVLGGFKMVLNSSNKWVFDSYVAEEVLTEVTGLTPEVYSSFYRFNLSEYDAGPQTHAVAKAMQSIANDIYYGDDPANKLIGAGASGGWNCLGYLGSVKSFGGALSELAVQFADIDKITIPAGTRFPSIKMFSPAYEGAYRVYVTGHDAVLKKNGTSWQLVQLIKNDELVQNSDYMLFTPSDFFGGSNNDWFFFTKVNGTQELDTLNFGLQYNLTLTETELAGYQTLRFGTTLTGNDYLQLLINYKVNTYISKFNGVSGNIASSVKSINVSEGTHTYEFYSIKVGENSVRFIFGIDGELIFKTDALDATGAHCQHIALHSGSTGAASTAYSECTQTKADAIARFTRLKLHSEDISFDDNRDTGACAGENGYYAKAKAFYNTYVTPNQKIEFASGASYADARARMVAWAAANGETLSFNASTGALVIASNYAPLAIITKNENLVAAIIALVFIGISTTFAVLWILRKRKLAK